MFRMVINLSKNFPQTQSFFIVSNEKELIFFLEKTGSRERKSLNFKRPSKTFNQDIKPISNYIYPLQHPVIYLNPNLSYQMIGTALRHLFPFHPLIPTDWHQEEPLGYSLFGDPNQLFTQHIYPETEST